jgi:hypothetical protein
MDAREQAELTGTVLAIFHNVSTEVPSKGQLSGSFVLSDSSGDLLFWFRSCRGALQRGIARCQAVDVILKLLNVQKILVSYHPTESSYVLINTITPSTMHQFSFPAGSSYQALHLAQLLALRASPPSRLCESVDFIIDSIEASADRYHLLDITVNHGVIRMPPEFGFTKTEIEFVPPDLHIMAGFRVQADDFMTNPITDISSFASLEKLQIAARSRGISPRQRAAVWPILFRVLPLGPGRADVLKSRTAEYLSVRKQWISMSKMQFKYKHIICDAFTTIRVDVRRTHPPDVITSIPNWDSILVNILRTFTLWNLDVRYTQGLNDLAVIFMTVFMPAVGETLTGDEAEALAFWCFAAFVELIGSGLIAENMMVMQDRELKQIMSIIASFHPACAKWLTSSGLEDLSFLISSFILAYGRSFEPPAIVRVWEALVTVQAPWLFLRYFSASLLILSFPSFLKVSNCSVGKLVSLMDEVFRQQDVGAVIGVSLSMMEKSKAAVQTEIRNREPPPKTQEAKDPFEPVLKYARCYFDNGQLFT